MLVYIIRNEKKEGNKFANVCSFMFYCLL